MARRKIGNKTVLPDGRILVRVSRGTSLAGTQRTLSRVVDTDDEAERTIAELAVRLGASPLAGERATLGWYFPALFLPGRRGTVTNAMMRQYESVWRCHVAPAFARVPMADITHAAVQAWLYTKTRPTAEKCVRVLRAVMGQARMDGCTDNRVMEDRYRMPAGTRRPGPVWGADEVARALPVVRRTDLGRLWAVMVGGGAGREEAYALYERDLAYTPVTRMGPDGPEEGWVATAVVDDAVTPDDGRKPPKNDRRYRTLVIPDPFATLLHDTRAEDPDAPICQMAVSSVPQAWRRLWEPRRDGREPGPGSWRGAMLETGVPFVPINRMRATHETLMQQAGVQDTLNAALHGRSNVQTGYRHYLAPGSPSAAAAAEALGRAFEPLRVAR